MLNSYTQTHDVSTLMEEIIMVEEIHVACLCCKNKRLFDADINTEGVIKIKCPICKSVIAVKFHLKKVRTEQIGT